MSAPLLNPTRRHLLTRTGGGVDVQRTGEGHQRSPLVRTHVDPRRAFRTAHGRGFYCFCPERPGEIWSETSRPIRIAG